MHDVLDSINKFATRIEGQMIDIKTRFTNVESQIVTKDYLDKKITEVRGDLIALTRTEDIAIPSNHVQTNTLIRMLPMRRSIP